MGRSKKQEASKKKQEASKKKQKEKKEGLKGVGLLSERRDAPYRRLNTFGSP